MFNRGSNIPASFTGETIDIDVDVDIDALPDSGFIFTTLMIPRLLEVSLDVSFPVCLANTWRDPQLTFSFSSGAFFAIFHHFFSHFSQRSWSRSPHAGLPMAQLGDDDVRQRLHLRHALRVLPRHQQCPSSSDLERQGMLALYVRRIV